MRRRPAQLLVLLVCAPFALSCSRKKESPPAPQPSVAVVTVPSAPAPRVLYLPDGAVPATAASNLDAIGAAKVPIAGFGRCPAEMVDVGGRFCIDRFEASLVDARSGRRLSPFYHPKRSQMRTTFRHWQKQRLEMGNTNARNMPVPDPPEWQLSEGFEPKAVSERGVLPNGYLNYEIAQLACRNAGKRLCTGEEWVTACRGHQGRKYPYGESYVQGTCNVHRDAHPAMLLHDNASIGHLDPRLNQVEAADGPLLRVTGATTACRSEWGADAANDMVGNLDEWIDDPGGTFVGGFFSRNTKEGCDARIESHPAEYFDYSLGVRCCR